MEKNGNFWEPNLLMEQPAPAIADTSHFPPFKRIHKREIAPQIAQHLALLMRQVGPDTSISLKIPAATTLCDFYNCTALDVLDGLYAFRQKNYEYVMNGLDSEITLHSHPHIFKTRTKSLWQGPWELTHKIAESPFMNLFQGKVG